MRGGHFPRRGSTQPSGKHEFLPRGREIGSRGSPIRRETSLRPPFRADIAFSSLGHRRLREVSGMTDIGRSVRRPTFWFASATAFIVAAAYPVALAIQCESREAERWMQNDVAFTVYVLWLFPLVVGLLVTSIFPGIRRHLAASNRRILDTIAFVLVLAALVVVVTDVGRVDTDQLPVAAEPALLRGRDAMQFDAAVRLPLRKADAPLVVTRFLTDDANNTA